MSKPIPLALLALYVLSCSNCDEGTGPVDDIKPGRRDYTWFVDTIRTPENIISGIDGISSTDLWAVTIPGDYRQTFFHFNGISWSTDGINRPFSPQRVRVVASNNGWSVGSQGDIWHFDGNQWQAQSRVTVDSNYYVSLEDIDGDSPNNMYAVGTFFDNGQNLHSLIHHFDGNSWSRVATIDAHCTLARIRFYAQGRALILGSAHIPDGSVPDSSKIFEFNGTSLKEIYSGLESASEVGSFTPIQNGIIIARGRKLSFYDGKNEQGIVTLASGNVINARNTKDIVIGGPDGIAHYDGTDVQYLYRFSVSTTRIDGSEVFDNAVFVIAFDLTQRLNLVYRGYLQ
ncbi:MAG: hypothetical protein WBD36_10325 [Bacteroidota bacterium]